MATGYRPHLLGAEAILIGFGKSVLPAPTGSRRRVPSETTAVVIGGGLAGVAAATVLAERGVSVTILERGSVLGGRASAWPDRLDDGTPFHMERGFHAFFRQYYNLRALLKRVDPNLDMLAPMDDYPILGSGGAVETFSGLPNTPPFNVIELTRRTTHLGLRDLIKVNARSAMLMLAFDQDTIYERWDHESAKSYLDSLRFPAKARSMLFNVFSHSFFNPEEDMSAAELLMMFHFYFMGNPEGLIFDVVTRPFEQAIWQPLARYLESHGATLKLGTTAGSVTRNDGQWTVETDGGPVTADKLVLALSVPALQRLVAASPDLDDESWRRQVAGLRLTNPFVVWRLWLDQPVAPDRSPFAGTTGVGCLDNISLFHRLEDESKRWAQDNGGSVVELHAYAVAEDASEEQTRAELLAGLHELYPETRSAQVLHERYLHFRDCPAFTPGSYRTRPTVDAPIPEVAVCGDFVKLPMPSALMERAAASGIMAANHLLATSDVHPEPVHSIPRRGILSGLSSLLS